MLLRYRQSGPSGHSVAFAKDLWLCSERNRTAFKQQLAARFSR
ncbi:MAG: hypothetical protein ACYS0E_04515 [Planctomycetota bacterium]